MTAVDNPRGVGRVVLPDDLVLLDVPYEVTLHQEEGTDDVHMHGRLDVSYETATRLMEIPMMLTLVLEDGRAVDFRMTATTGQITNER
jgi:hypothetical protein